MTAHHPIAELDTIQEFAALSQHFANDAVVAPRYALVDGARFGCDKQVEDGGPCDHLCTNKGKYCSLHASNNIADTWWYAKRSVACAFGDIMVIIATRKLQRPRKKPKSQVQPQRRIGIISSIIAKIASQLKNS